MSTNQIKQSFFIRSLLVVVSILYLISPLHTEFSILFHKLSHQLAMEDHHAKAYIEKKNHHHTHYDHDFLASNHKNEFKEQHGENKFEVHNHELITFFNSVLNNSSSSESSEKYSFENKIDKHIPSYKLEIPPPLFVLKDKRLWAYNSSARSLLNEVKIPPPRNTPA